MFIDSLLCSNIIFYKTFLIIIIIGKLHYVESYMCKDI